MIGAIIGYLCIRLSLLPSLGDMGGAQSPSSLIAQLAHLTASLHQGGWGLARSQLIHISSGLVERGLLSLTKTLLSPY